ncbi:hypothetical protein D3C71_1585640 [compost metagenome]
MAATSPSAKAPANHSGFSRLGRAPSASRRCWVQARWSVSSRAASSRWAWSAGSRVMAACAVYRACAQTSPTWLTRISAPASFFWVGSSAPSSMPRAGVGSDARGVAKSVRSAVSAAISKESMEAFRLARAQKHNFHLDTNLRRWQELLQGAADRFCRGSWKCCNTATIFPFRVDCG